MPLPSNFAHPPGEDPHHYFRNVCLEFKKIIESSHKISELQEAMDRLINASKQMKWQHDKKAIYSKDIGEKALQKVWTEFTRYLISLEKNPNEATNQDLKEALQEVQRLIDNFRAL